MNLENFADYLKYPSRLYQLPYEELKSLTMQYPYCSNFHMLLLIKSKLESHPDLEKNLSKAATYTIDRKFLRKFMQEEELRPLTSQLTISEDEVLELKDLFTLEGQLEPIPANTGTPTQEGTPQAIAFDLFPESPDAGQPAEDWEGLAVESSEGENSKADVPEAAPDESYSEEPPPTLTPEHDRPVPEEVKDSSEIGIPDAAAAVPEEVSVLQLIPHIGTVLTIATDLFLPEPTPVLIAPFHLPESLLADCIAVDLLVQERWELQENTRSLEWDIPSSGTSAPVVGAPAVKNGIAPTPKSKFASYQKRYIKPLNKKDDLPVISSEAETEDPRQVAAKSVREDLGVASETLAGLLVQQHQYDRAVKMYQHLSLLIPEKNTYFAAKIDEIKKL